MNTEIYEEFNKWSETITNYKFPRWNELPDIGYYMDQVIELMEKQLSVFSSEDSGKLISPSIVNNYVKLKIIPPPVKKRYNREHIALLLIICVLKSVIPIASIKDIIDIQIKDNSLENVYNHFCDEQETASNKTIESLNNHISTLLKTENKFEDNLGLLALKMGVVSNSNKIFSDKIISLTKGSTES